MRYPNNAIAIPVAEHIISVYGGGRYHIGKNTTTRKRILLAGQGSGKNVISSALGAITKELSKLNSEGMPYVVEAGSFLGADSFSFSMQHKDIEEHRVRSFVVNEAGVSGLSTAGDIGTMRAYQLNALSTKANDMLIPKQFTIRGRNSNDNQVNAVYNGVWVYFHESVVESYAEVLKDAGSFANGELSRADIFFADFNPETINNKGGSEMPEPVRDMLVELANDFKLTNTLGIEDADVWEEVDCSPIAQQLIDIEVDIVNQRKSEKDDLSQALLVRRFEKILNSVLINSIANKKVGEKPVAEQVYLDYAIARADAIDAALRYHCHGGALDNNLWMTAVKFFIKKIKRVIEKGDSNDLHKKGISKHKPVSYSKAAELQWRISLTTFDRVLTSGPIRLLAKESFFGDMTKTRDALFNELVRRDVLSPECEMFINSTGQEEIRVKKQRNKWFLNITVFSAPKK